MRGSWTGDEVRLESLVSLSPRLASVPYSRRAGCTRAKEFAKNLVLSRQFTVVSTPLFSSVLASPRGRARPSPAGARAAAVQCAHGMRMVAHGGGAEGALQAGSAPGRRQSGVGQPRPLPSGGKFSFVPWCTCVSASARQPVPCLSGQ